MLDKGLDLKENSVHGHTAGVKTGVSGQHTFLFFSGLSVCFYLLSSVLISFLWSWAPYSPSFQLSMWAVVTSSAVV